MFALTIDQRSSRVQPDRVPELLEALADVQTILPFERTTGDEVQGLLSLPVAVIDALERTLRSGDWSIGLGVGAVERPLPASVREARGPALLAARAAVERAKKVPTVRLAVDAATGDEVRAHEIEALMRLVGSVLQRRTPAQWRVVDAVRDHQDRAAAAEQLDITVQAISKSLLISNEDVVRDVYPLLARLLGETDGGSPR